MMRKGLVVFILATMMLTLFMTNTVQAVYPDVSVQPRLIQDETVKPLDPPPESHPTGHLYTAPVTNPGYAYDNNQLTYSSTNISQQPYPSKYSRPTARDPNDNATVTNPQYAYDLINSTSAALAVEKSTIKGKDYAYMRQFNLTTLNTTSITTISSIDIHIKYNLTFTKWSYTAKCWYGFVLYVGTNKKVTLQPLTETQENVTNTIGNWTAVTEPNDGIWSKTDVDNIIIGIQTRPNRTEDVGTFRAFEVWARVYSPVVKYLDVRTFSPTGIPGYSYLNVNINSSIVIGGCSYKVLVSVSSANTTLQNWSDVPQIAPDVFAWENVTEPNDGWWNQTDLSNLRVIIETQKIKSQNNGEFRIYEAWVTIKQPTVNSYPGNHGGAATVTNPTRAYDKNQMSYASISATGTTYTYFAVKSFNVTTLNEYATINIRMKYNVTTWNGRYAIYLSVGSKTLYLIKATNVNQTEPVIMTWVGVCEPNDGYWSTSDLSSMEMRVEVRKTLTTGSCTFREYDTWVTIPKDHFTVRAYVSDIQSSAPLYGWEFNLTYNPAVLRAVIVSEGPFLKQVAGGVTNFAGYTIPADNLGWVSSGCSVDQWLLPGGVYGSGALATITFQAIAKGNSMLNFTRVFLVSFDGVVPVDILNFTISAGWFQYLIGDVNGDATVDVYDLQQLGEAYGTTSGNPSYDADADQDKDRDVDGADLSTVSTHYGDT